MRTLIRTVTAAWRRPVSVTLGLLAACSVFAGAAVVRADFTARTHALHKEIATLPAEQRSIVGFGDYGSQLRQSGQVTVATLTAVTTQIYDALAPSTPLTPRTQAWAEVDTLPADLRNPAPSALLSPDAPPRLGVTYRENLRANTVLLSGRWPEKASVDSSGTVEIEGAVTASTLARFGVHVGSTLDLDTRLAPTRLTISGIIGPKDPAGTFWQSAGHLVTPGKYTPQIGAPYWIGEAVVGDAGFQVLGAMDRNEELVLSWTFPLALDKVDANGVAAVITRLTTLASALADSSAASTSASAPTLGTYIAPTSGAAAVALQSSATSTLVHFATAQSAGQLETAMLFASLTAIAVIALLLASRFTVERRRREYAVLQARGATMRALVRYSAVDGVLVVLPLSAAGLIASTALPWQAPPGWWHIVVAFAAVALGGPAVAVALAFRLKRRRANRPHTTPARRSRATSWARRRVLEGMLLVLSAAGLQQARSHGFAPGGAIDPLTACAPILAATVMTIAIVQAGPWLLRAAVRGGGRMRSPIVLLGLGRMAREANTAAAMVFILTLTLCTTDMAIALHGAGYDPGVRATSGPVLDATSAMIALLAVATAAAGCLVVLLAAGADGLQRRDSAARLTVMGLTAGQARAATIAELCAPLAFAVLAASAAVELALWTVRPALGQALGGAGARLTAEAFGLPVLAIGPTAVAAGLLGTLAARRRSADVLRLGDQTDGI